MFKYMPLDPALRFALADHVMMYGDGTAHPLGLLTQTARNPLPLPPETMTRQRRRARERRDRKATG